MVKGIPPGTSAANDRMLTIDDTRLDQLNDLEAEIDEKLDNPAYSTEAKQAKLNKIKSDVDKAREVLEQERVIRQNLKDDLSPPSDQTAAKEDLRSLETLRKKTYPQFYKRGAKVAQVCTQCLNNQIAAVKPAIMPKNAMQAADAVTGVFEGGAPDYCALADKPGDLGKLSYGKHQASETSGNLKRMLEQYSASTDPAPDPQIKSQMDAQLANFSANGTSYTGSAAERADFKKLLKVACKDPAMQQTQDIFFKEQFWDPAMEKANNYGVSSALGKAMYYDMEIQGPDLVDGFSRRALKQWSADNNVVPPATACKPDDPNGPDEQSYLYYVDQQRRKTMLNSSNPLYRATTYRPDTFDSLLDSGNMDLSEDFVVRGQPIKGIPTETSAPN